MPYVMVPVPEEHVEVVMEFVLNAMAERSTVPWDAESINELYESVDEVSRSLLAFVARAIVDGGELVDAEAAQRIQMSVRDTNAVMSKVNAKASEAGRPPLLTVRVASRRQPSGRVVDQRVFEMDLPLAELIRAAEQAELRDAASPLGGSGE